MILQILLFASGPFYCYPWKPIVNAVWGDAYEPGLLHFKHGHYGPVNVSLHFACLAIQLIGNFGLLHRVDESVLGGGSRWLSLLTAIVWGAYLLMSPAPLVISVLSSIAIGAAYLLAPHVTLQMYELGTPILFVCTLLLANAMSRPQKQVAAKTVAMVAAFFGGWYWGWDAIRAHYWGALASQHHVYAVCSVVALFLVGCSLLRNPVKVIVVGGTFVLKIAGTMIGSELMVFHGYAFLGSLCQGITHAVTKEEATLIALEREGPEAKLRFEYSHVTFFPNLLLHTARDMVFASSKAKH